MLQQDFELQPLQFDGRGQTGMTTRKTGAFLAFVHKREGMPLPVRYQRSFERGIRLPAQQLAGSRSQRAEDRVFTHAAKPVLRVRVIRFTPVQDRVDEVAIRVFNALDNAMRRLQVIVPQQRHGSDQVRLPSRQPQFASQIAESGGQAGGRLDMGPDDGAQTGWLRGVEQDANAIEHFTGHTRAK